MTRPDDDRLFARRLGVLVLLEAVVLLAGLGRATLWQIDEGRISECAREMAASGDWVTPRIAGAPFGAYPPLPYWLMAGSGLLLGFNEFAMRLPSALAGLGSVWITGLLVRRLAGVRAGLLAALILGTLPGFLQEVVTCRGGALATFFAVLSFERFIAWTAGASRAWILMYAAAGLGLLAKGPVAIAVLGIGGLAWFVSTGRWNLLPRMRWHLGLPLVAMIVLPWYLLVWRANGPDFLRENLLLENVSAFVTGYQQRRPWYFYLYTLPPVALPWILALLLARPFRGAPGQALALLWTAGLFLFLTASSAKRQSYLLFLFPALASAAGIALAAAWEERPEVLRRGIAALGALGVAAGAVLAALPVSAWTGKNLRLLADLLPGIGLVAAAGLGLLAVAAWRGGPALAVGGLAGALAAAFLVGQVFILPRLDAEGREGVAFCRRVTGRVPAGEPLAILGTGGAEGAVHFYVGRSLPCRGAAKGYFIAPEDLLASAGPRAEVLDSMADTRGRRKLLVRILE